MHRHHLIALPVIGRLALPSMFHRGKRGRRLIDEVMKHPAYAATPAAFQDAARKIAAKAAS